MDGGTKQVPKARFAEPWLSVRERTPTPQRRRPAGRQRKGASRAGPKLLPRLFRCGFFLFFQPRAAEDVAERVVALLARVLVQQIARRRPRVLRRPRPRPRLRIVDGELIAKRPRVDAREALRDLQVLRGTTEPRLVRE